MVKTTLNIYSLACHGILEDILNRAVQGIHSEAQGMDAFLQMVQLSSVCRRWSQCLVAPMCRTAIVEYRAIPHHVPGKYSFPSYKWVSNISFIAVRGLAHKTTSLLISDANGTGTSSFVTAMDGFQFGSYSWNGVELLRLGCSTFMDRQVANLSTFNSVVSLLTSSLPYITEVDYRSDRGSHNQGITLRATLTNHYLPRSRAVCIRELHPSASLRLQRQDITSLDINAYFIAYSLIPLQLPCSALQCLRVVGANGGFSWRWFAHDISEQRIVFPELKKLTLEFLCAGIDLGAASFTALGLSFPKLQMLRTLNALVQYSDFYTAFVGSPLVSLHIAELDDHIGYIDSSLIRRVQILNVCSNGFAPTSFSTDCTYSNLLSAYSTTRSATLNAISCTELVTIRWTNLRRLNLQLSSLCFQSLDLLLARLPSLRYLCISYLEYSLLSSRFYTSRYPNTRMPLDPLSETLQYVSLVVSDTSLHQASVKWLCNLILHVPSLLKLAILPDCIDETEKFAALHGKDIRVDKIDNSRKIYF